VVLGEYIQINQELMVDGLSLVPFMLVLVEVVDHIKVQEREEMV
jgi:hypothetical protein